MEAYWTSTGEVRKTASDKCLHSLPVMKGQFYAVREEPVMMMISNESLHKPEKIAGPEVVVNELPFESKTAVVLEEIFPRLGPSRGAFIPSRSDEEKCADPLSRPMPKKSSKSRFTQSSPSLIERGVSSDVGSKKKRKSNRGIPFALRRVASSGRKDGAVARLMQFRQKILEQFSSISGAFEAFIAELKTTELTRKEFQRFLKTHFLHSSREEQDSIFELLDHDRNGSISLLEVHRAIEAHTPVRTLEDLRRKWVALGFTSVRQAVREMDPNKEFLNRRLTLQEFASLFSRVGILEDSEHRLLFIAVSDTNDIGGTATLNELSSALAAVSPSLLLEDVRDRLIKKFGSIKEAFAVLDVDKEVRIKHTEFYHYAVQHWRLSHYEAKKAFHLMDVDGNHCLSRSEFMSALALSEPSLQLEEVRKKVRQRYKSIREALARTEGREAAPPAEAPVPPPPPAATSNPKESHLKRRDSSSMGLPSPSPEASPEGRRQRAETPQSPPLRSRMEGSRGSTFILGAAAARENAFGVQSGALDGQRASALNFLNVIKEDRREFAEKEQQTPEEFHAILSQVQLSESDTQVLFQLADIDGDGCLEPKEFNRAILLFAPCCALEDLRLECLRCHSHVKDAFASVPKEKRDVVLDLEELRHLLKELDLVVGVDVEAVHDIVEPVREGGVTVGELIVALRASASGATVPLSEDELNARARQQIHWQMAPFHKNAAELRAGLRQRYQDAARLSRVEEPKAEDNSPPSLFANRRNKGRKPNHLPRPGVGDAGALHSSDDEVIALDENEKHYQTRASLGEPHLRHSWMKVTKQLESGLPSRDAAPLLDRLQGYYNSAGTTISKDAAVLARQHSRFEHLQVSNIHQAALTSSLVKRIVEKM